MTALRAITAALVLAVALLPGGGQAGARYTTYARVTGYTCPPYCGTTASGAQVRLGIAACSRDIPLGSTVYVAGDPYLCGDTGDLDCAKYQLRCDSWIDIFAGSDASWVPAAYGDYQYVEVVQ